jgi:hypothetical protein
MRGRGFVVALRHKLRQAGAALVHLLEHEVLAGQVLIHLR